jgi:hypothetical protein
VAAYLDRIGAAGGAPPDDAPLPLAAVRADRSSVVLSRRGRGQWALARAPQRLSDGWCGGAELAGGRSPDAVPGSCATVPAGGEDAYLRPSPPLTVSGAT